MGTHDAQLQETLVIVVKTNKNKHCLGACDVELHYCVSSCDWQVKSAGRMN